MGRRTIPYAMDQPWASDAVKCVRAYLHEFPEQWTLVTDRDHNVPLLLYTSRDVVSLIEDIIARFGYRLSFSSVSLVLRHLHNQARG